MSPDVTQERQVVQIIQPLRIVQHQSVRISLTIGQVLRKNLLHPIDIGVNRRLIQQRPLIRPERRIANLGGATTHQSDRLAATFLEPAQHHDVHQMTNMQRFSCRIISNIGGHNPAAQRIIQALIVRAIGQKTALHHDFDEFRLGMIGHGLVPKGVCLHSIGRSVG